MQPPLHSYAAVEVPSVTSDSNVSVVLAVAGLPSFVGMPAVASIPAVAGFPTVVNITFIPIVIGFSTNSVVPAVVWRPLMFQLSLVLLPVLLLLLFRPWGPFWQESLLWLASLLWPASLLLLMIRLFLASLVLLAPCHVVDCYNL